MRNNRRNLKGVFREVNDKLLNALEKIIVDNTEYRYQVYKEQINGLLIADKLRKKTLGEECNKFYCTQIKDISKALSKQTRYCVPSECFRALLNACYDKQTYNVETYIKLLNALGVKVIEKL